MSITNSSFYVKRSSILKNFPVTLLEVKKFLRIENHLDDNLLSNLISMASEYAQWYMERSLMLQTWQISCYGYIPSSVQLVFGPIIKVKSIKILYQDNKEEVMRDKYYCVDTIQECININYYKHNEILKMDILYDAGYEDQQLIPLQIKQGIIQHVMISYKNRESENFKDLLSIKDIYSQFRKLKIVL